MNAAKWGKIPDAELRSNGWKQESATGGWRKNGAYFWQRRNGAMVGQFEGLDFPYRVLIDMEPRLPQVVKLHLINAVAEAANIVAEDAP